MEEVCDHGMVIYLLKDGTKFYSCSRCNPETKQMYDKPKYRATLVGDMCCNDTLLYLAEHSVISASVPDWSMDSFIEMYEFYKDREPVFGPHCHRHGAVRKVNKYTYDMSVIFTPAEGLNFNKGLEIQEMDTNRLRIYSNEFVRFLFSVGFDLGVHHDTDKILEYTLK